MSEARIKLKVCEGGRCWEIKGLDLEEARVTARRLILSRYHVETCLDEDEEEDKAEAEAYRDGRPHL